MDLLKYCCILIMFTENQTEAALGNGTTTNQNGEFYHNRF